MLLPIGTDRPLKRPTLMNHALLFACVAVFMVQIATTDDRGDSALMVSGMLKPTDFHWWNLLSYQFLHGGPMHLLGNMLFLWVFGPNIEDRLGKIAHLALFLIGGIAAGGMHALFDNAPVVGASGSIAAVTGAYMVFFPRTHIRVLLFFFLIGVYNIPSLWFIGFAIARDLFFQSVESAGGGASGVAHLAHLGGYGFGFTVAMILLATRAIPREPYDLFSLTRQANRRREFRAATAKGNSPWAHEPAYSMKKPEKEDPKRDERLAARQRVTDAVRAGDCDAAIAHYDTYAEDEHPLPLESAALLELGGWCFERNDHARADAVYDRFLALARDTPEAHRVRLMSALIRARYTHRSAGAAERLAAINRDRLTDAEAALFDTLSAEVSP